MLNQVILVGRLTSNPEVKELESGKKVCNITLAVSRSYKNVDGVYETDFVDCKVFDGVAQSTNEYCKKGDIVGVKGRLQTRTYEKEDGTKSKILEVVAEKVTSLSIKKENEESGN